VKYNGLELEFDFDITQMPEYRSNLDRNTGHGMRGRDLDLCCLKLIL
jgi:hypothetical protein